MKILYATRLFSGLQTTLAARRWQPTGVPTIFKLIEALDGGDQPVFVWACKDEGGAWTESRDSVVQLEGLRHPVHVLAGRRRAGRWLPPLAGLLREAAHAFAIARLYRRHRPDVVYLDHANLFAAAWLSLTTRARIVLRIMGVYPVMRAALDGQGPKAKLLRWCYGRPYALVVCTQDGSGVEPWLERALHPGVARVVLVNGIDEPVLAAPEARIAAIPRDRTVVMFLGKLDPAKCPVQFADAFLRARQAMPGRLHALMIGTGSLNDTVRGKFAGAGAEADLTLIERLPHAQVSAALARADIYVSLNRYGNMSNANLEAMRAGKAMIFPQAQPDVGVDVATNKILSPDSALRVESSDDIAGVADAIVHLARDPEERQRRGETIRQDSARFALNWQQRIDTEIKMLRRVARAEDPCGDTPVRAGPMDRAERAGR